ncbi:class I adenylate-forming enzyme family protein [Paenarthrobacter sp. NPDC090522]|uniref:class I adenylate-forming enzyme family protein n=1 Tax=Paenarthrobacter sp. NPDC090522 TaxID=3364383 RepID=UPI003827BEA6
MINVDIIRRRASASPHDVAIRHRGNELTWAEYLHHVHRVLGWLDANLPKDSDVVAIEAEATPEVFILASALTSLGTPWVALDPSKPDTVRAHQREALNPAIVATASAEGALLLSSDGCQRDAVALASIRQQGTIAFRSRPFRALGFTSGTTGMPKTVIRTSPSEARRSQMLIRRYGFSPADVFLLGLPLAHASGHGWTRTLMTAGASVVIGDTDPISLADSLKGSSITATLLVPPVLEEVVAELQRADHSGQFRTNLRFLLTGGRHLSATLLGRVHQTLGPVLHSYYGTTETGLNTLADPMDLLANPRTSGRPVDGTTIVITDGHGRPQPVGTAGRVAVHSYMNASDYGTGPIPTIDLGGQEFILTSDVGRINPNGSLELLGRAGLEIDAAACGDLIGLEDDLRLLPGVTAAAVQVSASCYVLNIVLASDPGVSADPVLLQYMALQCARLRGVVMPVKTDVVDRLRFNSTGKFDATRTLAHNSLSSITV